MVEALIIPLIIILGLDGRSSAATSAATAYAKQSGLEKTLREFTDREISPELRARIGQLAVVTKTLTEQKLTLRWEFQ